MTSINGMMTSIVGSNCGTVNFVAVGDSVHFDFLQRQCVAELSFNSQVSLKSRVESPIKGLATLSILKRL